MKTFIVRVQLTNELVRNYTVLKNNLLQVGFSKVIEASDKSKYILPNGNYLGKSEKTASEILSIVRRVLIKIGDPNAQVLVVESAPKSISWVNLTPTN